MGHRRNVDKTNVKHMSSILKEKCHFKSFKCVSPGLWVSSLSLDSETRWVTSMISGKVCFDQIWFMSKDTKLFVVLNLGLEMGIK